MPTCKNHPPKVGFWQWASQITWQKAAAPGRFGSADDVKAARVLPLPQCTCFEMGLRLKLPTAAAISKLITIQQHWVTIHVENQIDQVLQLTALSLQRFRYHSIHGVGLIPLLTQGDIFQSGGDRGSSLETFGLFSPDIRWFQSVMIEQWLMQTTTSSATLVQFGAPPKTDSPPTPIDCWFDARPGGQKGGWQSADGLFSGWKPSRGQHDRWQGGQLLDFHWPLSPGDLVATQSEVSSVQREDFCDQCERH